MYYFYILNLNFMCITKNDVINVAKTISVTLTENQINQVLNMYNDEENNDPTGTWNLIVENCIYQIIPNKFVGII